MDFEKQYYEADSFWKEGMVNDDSNRQRIIATANIIPSSVISLADVGCGNGVFLNYLQQNNPNISTIGIDRSEKALSYVKTEKKVGEINNLPFEDRHFDCVTCLQVLEHLPMPIYNKSLEEIARISNKYVIVSVPYDEKIENSYTKCPQCKTIFNSDLHLRKYVRSDIQNLLKNFQFECIDFFTLGESEKFLGHDKFVEIFYPEHKNRWNSPICPLCGFEDSQHNLATVNVTKGGTKTKRSLVSYFTTIPKLVWPKVKKDYWVVALYKRIS